jgi:hypothetical protein
MDFILSLMMVCLLMEGREREAKPIHTKETLGSKRVWRCRSGIR